MIKSLSNEILCWGRYTASMNQKRQYDILLTNDDGFNAIGFYPLLKSLSQHFSVLAVAPDSQKSWQGKSISKKPDLRVSKQQLHEFTVQTVNGTPADCVQIGLYDLLDTPPKLVISGVNSGSNAGRGRVLSSGTVGAAMEAALNGCKAIASSLYLQMSPAEYAAINFTSPAYYSLFEPAAEITSQIVRTLIDHQLPTDVDVITVNIPLKATIKTELEVTDLALDAYGQVFKRDGEHYVHLKNSLPTDQALPGTDVFALKSGRISVTPLNLDLSSRKSKGQLQSLLGSHLV